ncbi:hypothetical protein CVS40_3425 [Lucilia cuprina]|nr:hypothetical protein CVS40_3425 [Lucilia cuprina]
MSEEKNAAVCIRPIPQRRATAAVSGGRPSLTTPRVSGANKKQQPQVAGPSWLLLRVLGKGPSGRYLLPVVASTPAAESQPCWIPSQVQPLICGDNKVFPSALCECESRRTRCRALRNVSLESFPRHKTLPEGLFVQSAAASASLSVMAPNQDAFAETRSRPSIGRKPPARLKGFQSSRRGKAETRTSMPNVQPTKRENRRKPFNSDGAISRKRDYPSEDARRVLKILRRRPGPAPQNMMLVVPAALRFCSNTIQSLGEVWPGARLDVIPPHDPAEILAFLTSGNPHLPTHDWKKATVVPNKERWRHCVNAEYLPFAFTAVTPKRSAAASGSKLEAFRQRRMMDKGRRIPLLPRMMGDLWASLSLAEDGDSSQDSDPEDVDVTIVYDPDLGRWVEQHQLLCSSGLAERGEELILPSKNATKLLINPCNRIQPSAPKAATWRTTMVNKPKRPASRSVEIALSKLLITVSGSFRHQQQRLLACFLIHRYLHFELRHKSFSVAYSSSALKVDSIGDIDLLQIWIASSLSVCHEGRSCKLSSGLEADKPRGGVLIYEHKEGHARRSFNEAKRSGNWAFCSNIEALPNSRLRKILSKVKETFRSFLNTHFWLYSNNFDPYKAPAQDDLVVLLAAELYHSLSLLVIIPNNGPVLMCDFLFPRGKHGRIIVIPSLGPRLIILSSNSHMHIRGKSVETVFILLLVTNLENPWKAALITSFCPVVGFVEIFSQIGLIESSFRRDRRGTFHTLMEIAKRYFWLNRSLGYKSSRLLLMSRVAVFRRCIETYPKA